MTNARLVFVTAPDAEAAARLGRQLVDERLAACANILPLIRSIYRWQGAVHDEPEALLLLKTREDRVAALQARVGELHPYENPEALAVPVESGPANYLGWLAAMSAPA